MPPKRRYLRPHEERQSYARAEPAEALPGTPSLGDSFLIVCEGEVTEPRYLESLRDLLQLSAVDVRYEKSGKAFPWLWAALEPKVLEAVSNARFVRKHHETAATPSPANPSTDVDLLVASLNQAARPEMRLRPRPSPR